MFFASAGVVIFNFLNIKKKCFVQPRFQPVSFDIPLQVPNVTAHKFDKIINLSPPNPSQKTLIRSERWIQSAGWIYSLTTPADRLI